jgi:hypothetical protein
MKNVLTYIFTHFDHYISRTTAMSQLKNASCNWQYNTLFTPVHCSIPVAGRFHRGTGTTGAHYTARTF